MEDTKKFVWGKLLGVMTGFFLVIILWQIVVLELLKHGIISVPVSIILLAVGTCVVFGGIFQIIRFVLDGLRHIMNNPEEVVQTDGVVEKAGKLAQRNDDIGELARKVQDALVSVSYVVTGVKKATKELDEVSDEFQDIFGSMTSAVEHTEKEVEIPRIVLMYFAYQSNLDYDKCAYLYAYMEYYVIWFHNNNIKIDSTGKSKKSNG